MRLVVGTAGHIDHGKTTLLRALTGIDADRLPEEQRRGMTIDIGYAHLATDGGAIDFVDVPGHDRLVGNMLVGAGEIDAALLVVAADDGPRAQTEEHVALLDALGIAVGVVAITKTDVVQPERVAEVQTAIEPLLGGTGLAGSPIVAVSAPTGDGLDVLRAEILAMRSRIPVRPRTPARLAVDRVFTVKGRGLVVTGTLRGEPLAAGAVLRVVPGSGSVRVREVQVHGAPVERADPDGRTALNLVIGDAAIRRGSILTADPAVVSTDRVLVALATSLPDRTRRRLHVGTDAAEAVVGRSGRDAIELPDGRAAATLRLDQPVAAAPGDRFVLRRVDAPAAVGGVVLDPHPPRRISRRRQTPERVAALAAAVGAADEVRVAAARLDLHGLVPDDGAPALARDVAEAAAAAAVEAVRRAESAPSTTSGSTVTAIRDAAATAIRARVTTDRGAADRGAAARAARVVVDELVEAGRLVRDGDRLHTPGHRPAGPDPALERAKEGLVALLAVTAPRPLPEAARSAGCPPAAVRELEREGRIVVLEPDLAYAMSTYRDLAAKALDLAGRSPLTPAAFRDATGTSRKYVMPILEDLDRRGILRRTPAGHVPGPRAPAVAGRS